MIESSLPKVTKRLSHGSDGDWDPAARAHSVGLPPGPKSPIRSGRRCASSFGQQLHVQAGVPPTAGGLPPRCGQRSVAGPESVGRVIVARCQITESGAECVELTGILADGEHRGLLQWTQLRPSGLLVKMSEHGAQGESCHRLAAHGDLRQGATHEVQPVHVTMRWSWGAFGYGASRYRQALIPFGGQSQKESTSLSSSPQMPARSLGTRMGDRPQPSLRWYPPTHLVVLRLDRQLRQLPHSLTEEVGIQIQSQFTAGLRCWHGWSSDRALIL